LPGTPLLTTAETDQDVLPAAQYPSSLTRDVQRASCEPGDSTPVPTRSTDGAGRTTATRGRTGDSKAAQTASGTANEHAPQDPVMGPKNTGELSSLGNEPTLAGDLKELPLPRPSVKIHEYILLYNTYLPHEMHYSLALL